MFTHKTKLIASLMFLGTLTFAIPVSAQESFVPVDSANRINSANELVRQGEFDKAIEEYQQVTPSNADRDELNYNEAVAQFRKGDIQSAQAMFAKAAVSADTSIAADSRYNLGNCVYSTALKTAEQDKPAAIEQLRETISHYRDSLRLNSDNADARANIELAVEMIRKLHEEQKQEEQKDQQQQNQQSQDSQSQENQEQNQDQQQQNQSEDSKSDQQDSDQQNSDQQSGTEQSDPEQSKDDQSQSEGEQSKKNGTESDKSEQNPQQNDSHQNQSQDGESNNEESQNDKADQQSQQQDSGNEESDSHAQNSKQSEQKPDEDQQQQPNTNKQSQRNQSQTQSDQQSAGEPQADEQVGDEGDENNTAHDGQLTAAGDQDENAQPNGSVAMANPDAKDGLMTKEEAMKMLQAVRDRDMLRRLRQEQLERSRHVHVDKDW